MTREIVLDTETTGLSPGEGHRVVEIGCVELINHVPTGQHLHIYLNPERDMPEEARRIHGLDDAFLADKPLFSAEAERFLDFVATDTLVIHNASFDVGFLNAELERVGRPALKNPIIDTVKLARDVNPGSRASLDALCKLYGIDNSRRTLHGALLDSEILADVYLELIGGVRSPWHCRRRPKPNARQRRQGSRRSHANARRRCLRGSAPLCSTRTTRLLTASERPPSGRNTRTEPAGLTFGQASAVFSGSAPPSPFCCLASAARFER